MSRRYRSIYRQIRLAKCLQLPMSGCRLLLNHLGVYRVWTFAVSFECCSNLLLVFIMMRRQLHKTTAHERKVRKKSCNERNRWKHRRLCTQHWTSSRWLIEMFQSRKHLFSMQVALAKTMDIPFVINGCKEEWRKAKWVDMSHYAIYLRLGEGMQWESRYRPRNYPNY